MAALIGGSLAYDVVMRFDGRFHEQLLPGELHRLNVSFQARTMRREFGGCAGNIAYGLRLLGGEPIPVASLGGDGRPYRDRLVALGIPTRLVRDVPDALTAQAMVLTDAENNQITAFHPGAMALAADLPFDIGKEVRIASLSPDERNTTLRHAALLRAAGIPYLFDPGQALPMFDPDELRMLIDGAGWIAVNEYEGLLLAERLGEDVGALSRRVAGLVLTLGALGCQVWQDGDCTAVPGEVPAAVVDPTGCGDAFRAAVLFGLERGWPLMRCARLGNRMGALKVASAGAQNYLLNEAVPSFVSDGA